MLFNLINKVVNYLLFLKLILLKISDEMLLHYESMMCFDP